MTPRTALTVTGTAGLAVTVVGTFLPWLGSGTSKRNSYAAGGAARRLLNLSGPVHDLLGAWPLLGLAAAVAVAALVLGHPALALSVASGVAAVAGGCAAAVLPTRGNRYAHVLTTGPETTLVGAMLVALTVLIAVGVAIGRRTR